MATLLKNIRNIIYLISALIAVGFYLYYKNTILADDLLYIRLTQVYALTALSLLYCTLLPSPLYKVFPNLPLRPLIIKARKACGLSTFFFALIHATISFFKLLNGFEGLPFLSARYLQAITYSTTALIILTILAVTSHKKLIQLLGKFWKPVHRLLYIASILILIHALMLGTHFSDLSALIPQIMLSAIAILLVLEILRMNLYITQKIGYLPKFLPASCLFILGAIGYYIYLSPYLSGTKSANIHASHIASNNSSNQSSEYQVTALMNTTVPVNEQFTIQFKISNSRTNQTTQLFRIVHEKQLHAILVDSQLKSFQHLHPNLDNGIFTLTTSLAHEGYYILYLDYQPLGANEQISTIALHAGQAQSSIIKNNQPIDTNVTKLSKNSLVTLQTKQPFLSNLINLNKQSFGFFIQDSNTKQPVKDLEPYLGAFGHLVLINSDNYEYIHIHPNQIIASQNPQSGGPQVNFTALPGQKPILPGNYRMFVEFQRQKEIFVTDFTIKIQ